MSASGEPGSAPGPAPPSSSIPDPSLRTLLSVSKSLALAFALIAGLLFLLFLVFSLLDVVFGRGPGDLVAAAYCLASAVVNYLLWQQVPRFERLAADGQYLALREPLLVWGVVGVIFFVVVGVLLLVAWIRAEELGHRATG